MSLSDPYGGGIWGQYEQAQEQAPLLAGRLKSQDLQNTSQSQANDLAAATMPAKVQEANATATDMQNKADLSTAVTPLQIAAEKQKASAYATQMNGESLASAAKAINPESPTFADDFDKVIEDQIAQGNPLAKQFRGHPSLRALDTIMNLYGQAANTSPLASYTAAKGEGMPQAPPDKVEQVRSMLAAVPSDKWPALQAKMEKIKADIMMVDEAKDPKAALSSVAGDFGMRDLGDHFNPAMWAQTKANLAPQLAAYDEVVAQRASGAPAPPIPQTLEKVGDSLVGIAYDPKSGRYQATTLAQANKWKVAPGAVGPNGGAWLYNSDDPSQRVELPGQGKMTGLQLKLDMLKQSHPDWSADKLISAANGTGEVSARIITDTASAHVEQQIDASIAADPTYKPPSPAQKAQLIAAEVASMKATLGDDGVGYEGGPKAPAAAASPGLPPGAVQYLTEGHNTTFKNGQVWMLKGGKPVRVK